METILVSLEERKWEMEKSNKGTGKWKLEQFWFKINENEIWKMDTERKRLD